jgi:hypothetical protein
VEYSISGCTVQLANKQYVRSEDGDCSKYELMFWGAGGVVVTEIVSLTRSDGDEIGDVKQEGDFRKGESSAAAGAPAPSGVLARMHRDVGDYMPQSGVQEKGHWHPSKHPSTQASPCEYRTRWPLIRSNVASFLIMHVRGGT